MNSTRNKETKDLLKAYPKHCENCNIRYTSRKQICLKCLQRLTSMKTIGELREKENSTSRPKRPSTMYKQVHTVTGYNETTKEYDFLDKEKLRDPSIREEGDILDGLYDPHHTKVKLYFKEMFLSEYYNPNSNDSIRKIIESMCTTLCVCDFVDINDMQLQWCIIGSDEGAISLELLDIDAWENQNDSKFKRVLYWLGTGHLWMTYLRCTSKIIYRYIMPIYNELGFISPAQINLVRDSTSLWKGFDLIDKLMRPAFTKTFIRVWISSKPSDKTNFDEFWTWLNDSQNDRTFESNVHLWFYVVPALALIQKGIRNGNHTVYSAAVKFLTSMIIMRGHRNYVFLVVRDFLQVEKLYPVEVKELFNEYFSVNGQGHDFNLEEQIKNLKSVLYGDSQINYEMSSVIVLSMIQAREEFFKEFHVHENDRYRDNRKLPTNFKDKMDRVENYLWYNNSCIKIRNREDIYTCNPYDEPLDDNASVFELMKTGKIELANYVLSFLERKRKRPQMPQYYWLIDEEKPKGKKTDSNIAKKLKTD